MNYSAAVEIVTNEDAEPVGAEVVVNGHNLSDDLICMLAKHATAVDMGTDSDDLESRCSDWDIVSNDNGRAVVQLTFAGAYRV